MTKIVVLADIHIDDFKSDRPGERLNNYLKLAEIIRDKTIELKSPWIFLAGDILNRPISPPHVLNVLNRFIETLLQSGARIAFITGQHDQNVKELEQLKDTYLGIFTSEKVFYANGRVLNVDGTRIYFENFKRSEEVVPEKESDVYISHVTLGKQKVDNSKFKLGVFGDIHDRVDIGNMHSVCPPLCIHAHEEPKGIIGILTVGIPEPTFERFEYDPDFRIFPKLERECREVKQKEELSEEDKEVLRVLSCENDFYKEIEEAVDKLGLGEIHREIDITDAPEPISVGFRLTEVYARNFRSIEDVCFKFDDLGKIIFAYGDNGSGKTSIIEAIFAALLGDRHIDKHESKWAEKGSVMVGVKLDYKNQNYEICRGKGWTKFFINGEEVTKANKTALETYIYQVLPFLNLVWIFYIKTYEHFFDKDRVALVKKCFNLDLFDHFFNQGKMLLSSNKVSLAGAAERNSNLKGKYEQVTKQIEGIKQTLNEYDDVDISDLPTLTSTLGDVQAKLYSRANVQGKLETLISQRDSTQGQISGDLPSQETLTDWKKDLQDIKALEMKYRSEVRAYESLSTSMKSLKMVTCPNCGEVFQLGGEAIDSLKSKYDEAVSRASEYKGEADRLKAKSIPYSEEQLDSLIKRVDKQETLKSQLESTNIKIKELDDKLREIEEELKWLPTESELRDKILRIDRKKLLLKNKLDLETEQKGVITEAKACQAVRKELNRKIDLCEKYIKLFDMKNLDSMPYNLLVKISDYLSTEDIRFKTYSQLANGNLILDISCEMKVGNEFIDYDSCSHGQKAMMDFFILARFLELLGTTGIVAVDEGLAVLQPSNYDEACERLRNLQTHNIIITSHQLGFVEYDSMISCKLDEEGKTKIEVIK